MSEQTITEQFPWAVVGAEAVIYERGNWGYENMTPAKIAKVSKTRITLETGRTFYIPKRGGGALKELGRDYYRSPALIPADDPRIAEARETRRMEGIRLAARNAAEQYAKTSHSAEKARAAVEALQTFLKEWVEEP